MFDMFSHILPILLLIANSVALRVAQHARIVGHDAVLRSAYDFVIIGGGTSGLTVADRLTENAKS